MTACEQFLGKTEDEIQKIALVTLEGHQRAIMGSMSVEVRVEIQLFHTKNSRTVQIPFIVKGGAEL